MLFPVCKCDSQIYLNFGFNSFSWIEMKFLFLETKNTLIYYTHMELLFIIVINVQCCSHKLQLKNDDWNEG
jgi:hypothetical protein